MKKLLLLGILISNLVFAQNVIDNLEKNLDSAKKKSKSDSLNIEGWKKGGTFNLNANQSSFSNWIAGGNNSIGGNASINYFVNYTKGKWVWDNNFLLAYGLSKNEGKEVRKTDDRLEINSIVGREAFGNWKYSFFLNARTQFADGFDYDNDTDKEFPTSGFLKPGYLTFGPGFLWKKDDNLKFNLAPATSKITYISDEVFEYAAGIPVSSKDVTLFGVDAGENIRYELGFYASSYYKLALMENVSLENILILYSNYLEDPQNVDLDYTANLVMQINKFLATTLSFQAVYDDNAFEGFQIRQVLGLGLNYTLK